jgi:hypothetical protein
VRTACVYLQVFECSREEARAAWRAHRKQVAARVKQERHVAQNSTWVRKLHSTGAGACAPCDHPAPAFHPLLHAIPAPSPPRFCAGSV